MPPTYSKFQLFGRLSTWQILRCCPAILPCDTVPRVIGRGTQTVGVCFVEQAVANEGLGRAWPSSCVTIWIYLVRRDWPKRLSHPRIPGKNSNICESSQRVHQSNTPRGVTLVPANGPILVYSGGFGQVYRWMSSEEYCIVVTQLMRSLQHQGR